MSDVRELFDRVADDFDEVLPFFATFGEHLVDWIDPLPGTRLLDLAAGRGAITKPALARGCAVTAVDGAPRMVARITRELPRATAAVMDVERLDLPARSFDTVAAGFVMHLLAEPAVVAGEVRRVLRPGGRFALSVPTRRGRHSPALGSALFQEYERYADRTKLLPARDLDAEAVLRSAGFTDVTSTVATVRLPLADPDAFWRWSYSHGYRAFIDALAPEYQRELRQRLSDSIAGMDPMVLDRSATFWQGRAPR